jgi:SAM-dependent methyltransferase
MSKADLKDVVQGVLEGGLLSATLSSPQVKEENGFQKISIRPLMIKGQLMYQVSKHDRQKVYHGNLDLEACAKFIEELLQQYQQAVFTFKNSHYHVLVNKQNKMTIIKKDKEAKGRPLELHNRKKNYVLQEGVAVPFLKALGIMTETGKVVAKKYDKFRQVNRFLEMVRDVLEHLPKDRCLEIIDFGCGKAYLTFALHYYLHEMEKRKVHIQGLDLKEDVIAKCRQLADQLKLEGLSFAVGDINAFEYKGRVDMMIALHACDTATDAALEKAVHWNAGVILCVPCCQHELYSQIESDALETLLRHGILKERFAALATDAARADILTMLGYTVQVLEFIEMEHTPKNILLRAVKGVSEEKRKQAKERYRLFRKELNICPSLEKRFPAIT